MNDTPSAQLLLSVIIPTRNRAGQLYDCLRSLAAQDFPRPLWEVIVVFDGNGIHPGPEITAMAESLALTLATQPHSGSGMARNMGASRARGRFLVFIDDDCVAPAGWLSGYAQAFARNPERIIAGHCVNALSGNLYSQTTHDLVEYLQERAAAARRDPFVNSNNFGVSAAGFHKFGGFEQRHYRLFAEDRDFSARWSAAGGSIAYAADIVVSHAHALGLRSFLRQHYNYGRGAHAFLHAPAGRNSESTRWQPVSFYLSLLLWPVSPHRGGRPARIWPLLLASQCAQIAGYVRQWIGGT